MNLLVLIIVHLPRQLRESALLTFIDDNSRLEKKTGKRIRHALEDIVGLKQAAIHITYHRLANTARRDFLCEKIVKSVAGDRVQTFDFALADFDESCLLCKDAHYYAAQRASFARFGCLFRTLLAKTTMLINIHIERVPAALMPSTE